MKDLRFYGNASGTVVDITFRTDAISHTDESFNITQIQTGNSFETTDEQDSDHAALFNDFKKLPNSLSAFKAFAASKGLSLSISDSDGSNLTILREEESVSESY